MHDVHNPASLQPASPDATNLFFLSKAEFDAVKETEREWHDDFYRAHAHEAYPNSVDEFREVFTRIHLTPFCDGGWSWWADARREMLDRLGDVSGLRVLDYGCGYGTLGMYMALRGAEVWGFDLSGPSTATARDAARRYGIGARFEQMDAEELKYEDNSFDLVLGFGVLHHVIKYQRAAAELYRVLRPGCQAMFHETLWDNPVLNLGRRFTMKEQEAGDAPLTERTIVEFGQRFGRVRLEKRHLLYMLKRLAKLPPTSLESHLKPRHFWRFVKSTDDALLRLRPLQRYCGEVIVSLQK